MVDLVGPPAPRFGQAITATLLLAGVGLGVPALVYAVAGILGSSVVSRWRVDLYAAIWRRLVIPLAGPPDEREPAVLIGSQNCSRNRHSGGERTTRDWCRHFGVRDWAGGGPARRARRHYRALSWLTDVQTGAGAASTWRAVTLAAGRSDGLHQSCLRSNEPSTRSHRPSGHEHPCLFTFATMVGVWNRRRSRPPIDPPKWSD